MRSDSLAAPRLWACLRFDSALIVSSYMSPRNTSGPGFVRYFGPVISALKQLGGSGRPDEVCDIIARELGISETERTELMAGGAPRFSNWVAWARFYLVKAGYIDSSVHGVWSLTEKGRASEMTQEEALLAYHEVRTLMPPRSISTTPQVGSAAEEQISLEESLSTIGQDYRQQLLALLMALSPGGFERFCQRLLRESGFEQVTVTGRSGDGGIDGVGILQVSPLVSFKVLFQCKRYSGVVSASQVRDFRGAMMGRADKGIMLTTGTFTSDARREAVRDGVPSIELVDGEKLVDMCTEVELGLSPKKTYEVNTSFFEDFRT
jgi:restriction system protein